MTTQASIDWNLFQQELKGFVYKKVKDKTLAEDIVHDVFLKVQSKIQQLRDSQKISGWIYQITRNTIIDHYRTKAKSIDAQDLDWGNDTPNFNDCVLSYIRQIIPSLPEKYRYPLELSELKNVPQTEIAKELGISYTAAKARVQRARKMLRERMEEILIVKTDNYGNVILCEDRIPCKK